MTQLIRMGIRDKSGKTQIWHFCDPLNPIELNAQGVANLQGRVSDAVLAQTKMRPRVVLVLINNKSAEEAT